MQKLKQLISGGDEETEERVLEDESDGICYLSYAHSMIVFVKPIKSTILFSFGKLLAAGSTAFLIGPAQQINMMFDSVHVYATAV